VYDSPFEVNLGHTQGRIAPDASVYTPTDGSYAYALGDAADRSVSTMLIGDYVEVDQVLDLTGVDLIRLDGKLPQPTKMPLSRDISSGATLLRGSILNAGDDLSAIDAPNAAFTEDDDGAGCLIAGASGIFNNIINPLGSILSGTRALLHYPIVAESTGFTATLLALRWEFSIVIDSFTKYLQVVLQPGQEHTTTDLAANVSKATGLHGVAFRLTLVRG
jgi:hypothetical protein